MANGRALIVDDHELFRGGLLHLLSDMGNFDHIDQVDGLDDAVAAITAGPTPDLVTFDLCMPGLSGLEGLSAMLEALPDAYIVVIAGSERREDILGALGVGAHGYIPKSLSSAEIAGAIKHVLAGQIYAPVALQKTERSRTPPPVPASTSEDENGFSFTKRQKAVLDCLLTGASTRKIASQLNLAEGTVKIHLAAIYRVLGVHSRAEAIAKLK